MVFRVSSHSPPAIATLAEPARVSPLQRLVAFLIAFSLAIPPGVVFSAPVEQVPLDYFAANDTAETPAAGGNAAVPDPAEPASAPEPQEPAWKPGDPEPAEAATEDIAPPDGVPVQAPFPADGSPQAEPGIPLPPGNCVITGEVSDATSLNPIAGAFVDAVGTGRSVQTDGLGKFRIEGLPPGSYTLEATKLGFFTETTVITAIEAQPAVARFGLRLKPVDDAIEIFTLEEETVVGEYQGDSQGDLFLNLDAEPNIVSGIGKDDFTEQGISDAGDAVSKIAGANIVGGKYAVVRGLGDRYSNTTVNGALISSADPSKKAVQLDLFPSDLLQSIKIYKNFTPNLPGEFAGGLVAIETLSFPEEPFADFEYSIGTNENLDGDEFWAVPGRGLGFLGQPDDGLPSEIGELEDGILARGWTSSRPPTSASQKAIAQQAVDAWSALHTSSGMQPEKKSPEPGQELSASFGNTFDFENGIQLGVVASGVWNTGNMVREDVTVGRLFTPGDDFIPGTSDDGVNRSQNEDRYTATTGYGLLGSLGLRLGDRHQVGYTYFQNHRADDEVVLGRQVVETGRGFRDFLPSGDGVFGAGAYTYQAFDSINPVQRTLTLNQLNGSHEMGDEDNPIEIDWLLSRSDAVEDRPNSSTLYFSELDFTDPRIASEKGDVYNPSLGVVYTLPDVYDNTPAIVESYRESLTTTEEAGNETLDLTLPLWASGNDSFKLSIGGAHFDRKREVRGRLFTYSLSGGLNSDLINENSGQYGVDYLDSWDSLYAPDGSLKFDGWNNQPRSDKLILSEASLAGRTVRNVDASTDLTAGYLMGSAAIGKWDLIGGVRYEGETRTYQVIPGLNPSFAVNTSPVSQDAGYLLPGILLTRDFGDDDQFTAILAWSKTVARPTFYEFAPVITEDQASGDEVEGNPDLTDTLISNFDIGASWRPRSGTSISAGLFYKDMQDPIAQAYLLTRKTWINGEQGELKGIELEAAQSFLEYWSVSTNFTYIDSSLVYIQGQGANAATINSTFEGQPEYIFNFNLGYSHPETGWSANLVYNYTGSYLTGVPLSDVDPPIRRESFELLDLIVQKQFDIGNGVGVLKFKCGNLLNSTDTQVFEDTDQIYQSYQPGRSFSVSFKYEF